MNENRWVRRTMAALGLLAAAALVIEYGFPLGDRWRRLLDVLDVTIAALFGLELIVTAALTRLASIRERWYEYLLLLAFATAIGVLRLGVEGPRLQELLAALHLPSATKLYLILVQIFVLTGVLVRFLRGQKELLARDIRPERLFAAGFAFLILLGTAALLLPRASANPDRPLSVLDAFYTATSAVCVTGLTVRDTGTELTHLGQGIVLALFQFGGLGIAAFVGWLSVVSGRGFSVPETIAMRELVNASSLADVRRHVMAIVLTALAIEAAGAALLWSTVAPPDWSALERVHWAVFHSVSAFCNAGFALQSDSLEGFRGHLAVNGCIAGLIVLGGLGPTVLRDLAGYLRRWRPPRRVTRETLARQHPLPRLRIQTRLALNVSAILIVAGAATFALTEWNGVLRDSPLAERILAPIFQSVTARTAGFDTVPMGALRDTTLLLLVVLMVVGASPVSTGGGIKTVTVGVLFATMRSIVRGRNPELYHRSIPVRIIRASVSIFLIYVILAVLGVFLLSATDPEIGLRDRVFELVSALSTVGLSTGHSAEFSSAGQLVLCLAMFAGRIGPLTLAITLFRGHPAPSYTYPEEGLVLG